MPGRLGVLDQDVQLGPVAGAQACGRRDVDPRVADGARDKRQGSGRVLNVDDQVHCHMSSPPVVARRCADSLTHPHRSGSGARLLTPRRRVAAASRRAAGPWRSVGSGAPARGPRAPAQRSAAGRARQPRRDGDRVAGPPAERPHSRIGLGEAGGDRVHLACRAVVDDVDERQAGRQRAASANASAVMSRRGMTAPTNASMTMASQRPAGWPETKARPSA